MRVKNFAAGAAMVGAVSLGALGFGHGIAQAKPHVPGPPPIPVPGDWIPGDVDWNPGGPPGHNPWGPPGQVKHGNPVVPGLTGVPPGHWGDPTWVGLPSIWLPDNWVDLGIPNNIPGLPLVLNPNGDGTWGIIWNGVFVPYPVQPS